LPARRCLHILHLAGKASIRRRPVNSAMARLVFTPQLRRFLDEAKLK
jgi:hypothetical protein